MCSSPFVVIVSCCILVIFFFLPQPFFESFFPIFFLPHHHASITFFLADTEDWGLTQPAATLDELCSFSLFVCLVSLRQTAWDNYLLRKVSHSSLRFSWAFFPFSLLSFHHFIILLVFYPPFVSAFLCGFLFSTSPFCLCFDPVGRRSVPLFQHITT